jgi:hypothetical protein
VVANEAVAVAEHEGKSKREEEQAAKAGVDDALHQHVDSFARPAKARFQHGEAYLHAKNQEGGQERPHSVKWVDDITGLHVAVRGKCPQTDQVRKESNARDQQRNAHRLPNQKQPARTAAIRDREGETVGAKFSVTKSVFFSSSASAGPLFQITVALFDLRLNTNDCPTQQALNFSCIRSPASWIRSVRVSSTTENLDVTAD